MLGLILLEVSQAETIDIGCKRAKTAAEGEGNVRSSRLTVADNIVNLQVGIQIGLLVFDVVLNLYGRLVDEFLLVVIIVGLPCVALLGMFAFRSGENAQSAPYGHDVEQQHDIAY